MLGCSPGSGEQVKGVGVGGAHDPEVSFVERGDDGLVETFGCCDGGGVDDVEAGIGVGGDEFVNASPVGSGEIDDTDVAGQDRSYEALLSIGAVAVQQQPSGFGDNLRGRNEVTTMRVDHPEACSMVLGASIRGGQPDVGVNQHHRRLGAAPSVCSFAQHVRVSRSPVRVT